MSTILCLLLGALAFSWVAIWNGFPLLFFDSFGYMTDGFSGYFESVRLVGYAFWVRFTSFSGFSIWGPVLIQNLMLSFVLWRLQVLLSGKTRPFLLVFVYFVSAIIFGAAWVQSQISADAMTPVVVISFLILAVEQKHPFPLTIVIAGCFLISVLSHVSHLGMVGLVFLGMAVREGVTRFRFGRKSADLRWVGLLVLLAFILAPLLNRVSSGDFKPIQSYQPHLLARLYEGGILNRLLAEHCSEKSYLFCAHRPKEGLIPREFIWSKDGPINETKGQVDNPEYAEMISDSLRFYPGAVLIDALDSSSQQLFRFSLGDGLNSYLQSRWINLGIQKFFPDDFESFKSARQQAGWFEFKWPNRILWEGLALLGVLLFIWRKQVQSSLKDSKKREAIGLLLACVIANAIVCGTLSTAADRYGARVIWLIPALALMCFVPRSRSS